jgi:predicted small secreted protein
MAKSLLIIGLIFASFTLQSCNSTTSRANEIQVSGEVVQYLNAQPEQENAITKISGGKVEYKGVSFKYNPQIFGEVEAKEVAEHPLQCDDCKPDGVAPQHILFTFKKEHPREFTLAVYPVDDFRSVWCPVEKYTTKIFDEDLKYLKETIKNPKFRRDGEIPFLTYYDAHQTFQAKAKTFPFRDGKGIFFLTQINQDFANLVNNEELIYVYQGLSKDEKKYILAEFPVTVPFLPNRDADEFEGYKLPVRYYEADEKQHRNYIAKMTKRLENLKPNEFKPNLKYFEEIISSLEIEK